MPAALSPSAITAIKQKVAERFDDQVAFLQEMVRAPSLRGQEAGVQAIVADALRKRGYEVETYGIDLARLKDHPACSPATIDYAETHNVSGKKVPDTQSGRSLILNAHVDVVPTADPDQWTHPPFAAVRDGDWLYGRGAGDMKAGLSANIFAVDALAAAGFSLNAPLEIQSVIDEETTGNGAAAAIERGARADAVLIPEPTDEDLIYANSGVLKFEIKVQGVPAHPREPDSGLSAIEAAFLVINGLKELEALWNKEKDRHPGFCDLGNPASLNIGTIQGGEWQSSIPFACTLEGRIGFYPGDTTSGRMASFEAALHDLARTDPRLAKASPALTWTGTCQAGYVLQEGTGAETALAAAHGSVSEDTLKRSIMACYLDAALFMNHANIPALTYGPVSRNIHGIDECVNLPSLLRVTQTIALFTAQWCGISQT